MNIFFPVGTVLAERLLFLPSAGACMVIADLSSLWSMDYEKNLQHKLVLMTLLCLCALRVVIRNEDWNTEEGVYESALAVCPLSLKALSNYAAMNVRLLANLLDGMGDYCKCSW